MSFTYVREVKGIHQNFGITIVFDFPWDDCNTQEKLEAIVMQNVVGQARCIMVYMTY